MSSVTAGTPDLAQRLLSGVRMEDPGTVAAAEAALAALNVDRLAADLPDDATRAAVWINLYNAATQRLVDRDPVAFAQRTRFFRQPAITVAGVSLSLDTIEHGLLRRSRPKAGLGFVGNPFAGRFERRFRVERMDPRIHFALNCAATSCPPIAAYEADRLGAQLDLATRAYLAATVRRTGDHLVVPRIFRWFPGDFRRAGGVRGFLAAHGVPTDGLRLRYAAWDWTPAPDAWLHDVPSSALEPGDAEA